MSIAELILNSNLYFPHPFIKDYSHVKKNIVIYVRNRIVTGVAFNALADDANQGSGKITFKGEVIDAPCSIAPGDEDQTINLGEVDTVLKSGQKSLPVDVTIHLQDLLLTALTLLIKSKSPLVLPVLTLPTPTCLKTLWKVTSAAQLM